MPDRPPDPCERPAASAAGVFWLSEQGRIQSLNRAGASLLGAALAELVGRSLNEFLSLDGLGMSAEDAETGRTVGWDLLLTHALDQTLRVTPARGSSRGPGLLLELSRGEGLDGPGYTASLRLPSPEVSAADTAVREAEGLALLATEGPGAWFDLTFEPPAVHFSAAWHAQLGYLPGELDASYEAWTKLLHPDDSAAAPGLAMKTPSPTGRRAFSHEYRMRHKDGRYLWFQAIGVQVYDSQGHRLQRAVGLQTDVSERKEIEETGLRAEDRLQALGQPTGLPAFDFSFTEQTVWFSPAWYALVAHPTDLPDDADPHAPLLDPLGAEQLEDGLVAFFLRTFDEGRKPRVKITLRRRGGEPMSVLMGTTLQFSRRHDLIRVTGYAISLPVDHEAGEPTPSEDPRSDESAVVARPAMAATGRTGAFEPKRVELGTVPSRSARKRTGRILLMDDDPHIAALTAAMLGSLDYTYDVARNGEEAVALYRRYLQVGRPHDAVIMDLTVIGGMGGEECFLHLIEMDPHVCAIVSSGYDSDEMFERYLAMGFSGYLTKPYRVTELARILRAALGEMEQPC